MQFTSGKDVKENLKKILNIIHECIKERSDLIITPECTSIMSSDKKELLSKLNVMEDDIFLKEFKRVCKSNRKWIMLGSIIVKISKDTVDNRSILINPNGETEKFYDKVNKLVLIGSVYQRSEKQIEIIQQRYSAALNGTSITIDSIKRWFSESYINNNPQVYDFFYNLLEKKKDKDFLPAYKIFVNSDKYPINYSYNVQYI